MLLNNWTNEHSKKFRKEAFIVQHDILKTGLFTDEALIKLLDKHPRTHLDVCTMGHDEMYPNKFRTGQVENIEGRVLLEAAKKGVIWMNLRECMNIHPEYKAVLDQMYGELAAHSGHKSFSARGAILISSPYAKVPYHCDPTETILWHLRGHKRFYLYPTTPEYLPDEAYEKTLYDLDEDLPYNKNMEQGVKIFDLTDQQMITWPLNSPHRVENVTHCVSITTEYSSFESSFKNSVMYTNAFLRKRLNRNVREWAVMSRPEKIAKACMGRVLRKFGVLEAYKSEDIIDFKVDGSVEGFIKDIAPEIRKVA